MAKHRYVVANPFGEDGIRYLTLHRQLVPKWTLTLWKQPGKVFLASIEQKAKELAPNCYPILNADLLHNGAHYREPHGFSSANYFAHTHLMSRTLATDAVFGVFLAHLVQIGDLPQAETNAIALWAVGIHNGDNTDLDSDPEDDGF